MFGRVPYHIAQFNGPWVTGLAAIQEARALKVVR